MTELLICNAIDTCPSWATGDCGRNHHIVHKAVDWCTTPHDCLGDQNGSLCVPATPEQIASARLRGILKSD